MVKRTTRACVLAWRAETGVWVLTPAAEIVDGTFAFPSSAWAIVTPPTIQT